MTRAAVLRAVGGYVPSRVVANDELAQRLDTSDEWIRTRTGIGARHVVAEGETTLHLAVEAGARALKAVPDLTVDTVVVATTTPDRLCPATAPEVASRLGLGRISAFDVSAVCSGFVYAAAVASGLIAARTSDTALVVGSEAITGFLDPEDRGTAVIFGDGAGAVVLTAGSPEEPGAMGPFDLGSDGDASDLIAVEHGGSRTPPVARGPRDRGDFLTMGGREVYRRAIPGMAASCRTVLAARGWSIDDVDVLVAHQANARILEGVARQLGLPAERCYANIERVGNTAGASIPLAMADAVAEGALRPGQRVLVTAFGGGLTWGSTALVWPDLAAA